MKLFLCLLRFGKLVARVDTQLQAHLRSRRANTKRLDRDRSAKSRVLVEFQVDGQRAEASSAQDHKPQVREDQST